MRAMAMSQTFYREEVWRQAGFSSLEDFHVVSCAIQLESEY
jgi:homoserine O-acetyltransferase